MTKIIIWVSVLFIAVAVIMQSLRSVDVHAKYKQQCQMTCLERDVDKLRADIWDWKFLRYQICSGLFDEDNCLEPYVIKMDNVTSKYVLSVQLSNSYTADFVIESIKPETSQKLKKPKSKADNRTKEVYVKQSSNNSPWRSSPSVDHQHYISIEHRNSRFLYYDILDFNLYKSSEYIDFKISGNSILPEKTVLNFFTLFLIEIYYEKNGKDSWIMNVANKMEAVSIGTNIFYQRNIILTDGSKLYSWCSTFCCLWLYLVILYFVRKVLIAVHGFIEIFNLKFHGRRNLELTRPDVIQVDSGDLNILTSYFFSVLLGRQGCCRAIYFVIFFVLWFFSILAYFDEVKEFNIFRKGIFLCILIICSFSFFLLFPIAIVFVICFSMILFAPEQLIHVAYLCFKWYRVYILLLLLATFASSIFVFCCKICVKDLLFHGNLYHWLLWPKLPVQLLVCLTKKCFAGARLIIVQILIFLFLCILGFYFIIGPKELIFISYDPRYLHILSYWLFFPIYFALITYTFCITYKRVIIHVIEAIFTALFVAYLMNFLLGSLYQLLEWMDPKQIQYLYIMLVLHVIIYLLKIYRDWYSAYDKFLKDVITHVRDRYKCVENKARCETSDDCIALIHNHNDDNNVCQHPALRLSQGEIRESRFRIKGLMLLTKESNVYAPSDFFFEVIKLPGAPGSIKTVIMRELFTFVFLRIFPALFIYWLCTVMYLIDFDKYDAVIKVIIGSAFISQYKELFLYRKISLVDVKSNIAFQRQIQKFLNSYESSFFVCELKGE